MLRYMLNLLSLLVHKHVISLSCSSSSVSLVKKTLTGTVKIRRMLCHITTYGHLSKGKVQIYVYI